MASRVEEEIRKLLFELELSEGPFEVRGQEHRRIVGVHAAHQTQSVPSTGRVNDDGRPAPTVARQLGGCVICARSMWAEDFFELDLFTAPPPADEILGGEGDLGGDLEAEAGDGDG